MSLSCQNCKYCVNQSCRRRAPEKGEAGKGSVWPILYDPGAFWCGEFEPFSDKSLLGNKGETRIVNEKTGGEKCQKLARFDLLPAKALWKVAEHYGAGCKKYSDHNWRKGYAWSLSIAALERHFALWKEGERLDPETGTEHLAAVVFHALSLLVFSEEHPELDDRFKGGEK